MQRLKNLSRYCYSLCQKFFPIGRSLVCSSWEKWKRTVMGLLGWSGGKSLPTAICFKVISNSLCPIAACFKLMNEKSECGWICSAGRNFLAWYNYSYSWAKSSFKMWQLWPVFLRNYQIWSIGVCSEEEVSQNVALHRWLRIFKAICCLVWG